MKVLGISGSLRQGSHNTALLRAAQRLAPEGSRLELYDELELIPPYNEDRDGDAAPAAATRLRELVAGADAVLFATPEYNGSTPGQLKNALDWLSRPRGDAARGGCRQGSVDVARKLAGFGHSGVLIRRWRTYAATVANLCPPKMAFRPPHGERARGNSDLRRS